MTLAILVFPAMGAVCALKKGPVRGTIRESKGDWHAAILPVLFLLQTSLVPLFIWGWGHFTTWAYQRLALQQMD